LWQIETGEEREEIGDFVERTPLPPHSILKKERREERAEIGDIIRWRPSLHPHHYKKRWKESWDWTLHKKETPSPFSLLQNRGEGESRDWRLHKRGDPFSILIITKKRGRREQRLETS
jgi:hypothetical protein